MMVYKRVYLSEIKVHTLILRNLLKTHWNLTHLSIESLCMYIFPRCWRIYSNHRNGCFTPPSTNKNKTYYVFGEFI